jgi:hypothetical protein
MLSFEKVFEVLFFDGMLCFLHVIVKVLQKFPPLALILLYFLDPFFTHLIVVDNPRAKFPPYHLSVYGTAFVGG